MNAEEVNDQVLERSEDVEPLDADYLRRRSQALDAQREVFDEIFCDRAWHFRYTSGTVTVVVNTGYGVMPANFGGFGPKSGPGAVWLDATSGQRLTYIDPGEMRDLKMKPGTASPEPRVFSVYDFDAATYRPLLQVPTTSALSLPIFFERKTPTIDDSIVNAAALDADIDAIKIIGEEWHQPVLVPGVRARLRNDQADPIWKDQQQRYEKGLRRMRQQVRNYRHETQALSGFFDRR